MSITSETEIRGSGVKKILYGHVIELDTGEKLYIARRKHGDIYRGGRVSISGAMTDEVASWAIDENLVIGMRAKGVKFIGVREHDTGDVYLTRIESFFDRMRYKMKDYTGVGRGGSRQRYVPLQFFARKVGTVALDHAKLY